MKKENDYVTTDLYVASYLIAKGFKITGANKKDSKVAWSFEDDKKIGDAVIGYYNNAKVGITDLWSGFRVAKDLLYRD